jgi:hypothetical protein
MSQRKMETKITNLESKLVNIESKLDEVLKQLKNKNQTVKRTITKKTPSKNINIKQSITMGDKIMLTEHSDNIILVTGDTYECRHLLKPYRAKWEPEKKGWSIYIKNITNYSSFKNKLESSCKKFTIRDVATPFKTSSVNNRMSGGSTGGVCEIESSSDED